jgi:hypothetical protein
VLEGRPHVRGHDVEVLRGWDGANIYSEHGYRCCSKHSTKQHELAMLFLW